MNTMIRLRVPTIKFQTEEITEVKFIYYKKLQELIEKKEIQITPQYEEYDKLFDYLDSGNA